MSAAGGLAQRWWGAIGLPGLLIVLAACGGTVDPEDAAGRTLEVGSCFAVDAGGMVVPASCDVRNDGVVTAEVEDAQLCDLLSAGGVSPFVVVDGRTFCLRDARP